MEELANHFPAFIFAVAIVTAQVGIIAVKLRTDRLNRAPWATTK